MVPEYTGGYLCGMAVRACTERDEKGRRILPPAAFQALPLGDFMDICGKARNFLFRAPKGQPVGQWLRVQCLILARNNHTPADYWLSLPLRELGLWIEANNAIVENRGEGRNGR